MVLPFLSNFWKSTNADWHTRWAVRRDETEKSNGSLDIPTHARSQVHSTETESEDENEPSLHLYSCLN